jgi:hypothetical protein
MNRQQAEMENEVGVTTLSREQTQEIKKILETILTKSTYLVEAMEKHPDFDMAIRINGIQSFTLSQFKGVLQPIEVLGLDFTVGYNGYDRVLVQSVDTTFDFMYRLTVILDK